MRKTIEMGGGGDFLHMIFCSFSFVCFFFSFSFFLSFFFIVLFFFLFPFSI